MKEWSDYFIAMAGAAASLAGLLFVGLSINLAKILSIPKLANRALGSLILLILILITASLCLTPQPLGFIAVEIISIGIAAWFSISVLDLKMLKATGRENKGHAQQNIILSQIAILPYVIAGCTMYYCGEVGLYWLIPAFVLSICKALLDAWVLLIEINR